MRRDSALAAALLLIAVVTLSPRGGGSRTELMPLTDLRDAVGDRDLVLLFKAAANVLLFVPLGVALALRDVSIRTVLLYGVGVASFIEIAQWLVVAGRTSSVDDVLLNTLGAALGYLLLSSWRRRRRIQKT